MDYEGKKSGHIPAFGNWDYANDLPITKYFECARQAGLIRPSSSSSSPSSCQCGPCVKARCSYRTDVYTNTNTNTYTDTGDFKQARIRVVAVPSGKGSKVGKYKETRPPKVKEKKENKVMRNRTKEEHKSIITTNGQSLSMKQQQQQQRPTSPQYNNNNNNNVRTTVDEDLYEIPSNLLHNSSKQKKMLGFFSRCLVPPCRA